MTIEDLAGMVQRGFESTATKEDLRQLELRMATKDDIQILVEAIKDLEMRMSAYMSFNKEELDRLKNWMQTIDERVAFLEQKYKHKK